MRRQLGRMMRTALRSMRRRNPVARAVRSTLTRLLAPALVHAAKRSTARRASAHTGKRAAAGVHEPAGTFKAESYTGKAGTRRYRLFLPIVERAAPLPLVVMLHGCTQTAEDFALGTGMNELAADQRCAVAYPEQAVSANRSKCWNWFQASHQRRGNGEPAIIAGITRDIVRKYGLDPKRVYVAGLSAGGAMAAVMGRIYPDLYAAIGVHSGLPYGSAHDTASAFAAMRGEPHKRGEDTAAAPLVPAIVLHGDRDKTVHRSNGDRIANHFVERSGPGSMKLEKIRGRVNDAKRGRRYTRTLLRDGEGDLVLDYWLVHGGGHSWFGGKPGVSHTDPRGPNASQEMLRFFLQHRLQAGATE